MGQTQSSARAHGEAPQKYQSRSTDTAPSHLIIEKPKLTDNHPILQVPHTNVRIMHVDPGARAGIVPVHGYIALQVVAPSDSMMDNAESLRQEASISNNNRQPAGAAGSTKRDRDGVTVAKRRNSQQRGIGLGEGGALSANSSASAALHAGGGGLMDGFDIQSHSGFTSGGMDPEAAALLEKARSEYNADEHQSVTKEVKKWKGAFHVENGRAPNKKDIAANPYIFEKYYREKELEAMRQLIEQNQHVEEEEAGLSLGAQLVRDVTELETARAEFNALEYMDLHRDVKKWKLEFKEEHNRPPTKKDIVSDPTMFEKYYRLKELEAMKKLMEDAEAIEKAVIEMEENPDELGGGSTAADLVENARAQFDPEEYAELSKEVRQWKQAFKANRGRPPTKRDIQEDPEAFAKYYREKELAAMKRLIEDAESALRRASVIDADDALERAKSEYNAEEHQQLIEEVRSWKVMFKQTSDRAPTKKDIAQDKDMFAKYYRQKELDAMRRLLEEAEGLVAENSNVPSLGEQGSLRGRGESFAGHFSSFSMPDPATAWMDRIKKKARKEHGEREEGGEGDALVAAGAEDGGDTDFRSAATFSNEASALTTPQPTITDPENHKGNYTSKAPPPLTGFAPRFQSEGANSEAAISHAAAAFGAEDAAAESAVRTQFVFPKGHQAAERVFFFDEALQLDEKGQAMLGIPVQGHYDPVADANKYEIEEDDIYEMAGVHRPLPFPLDNEDQDPLASYEVQSNVLEAIRMAIDAPIEDFYTSEMAAGATDLQDFVENAMSEAHALFELERMKDVDFQKSYSVAHMMRGKSGVKSTLSRRMMTKMKSRVSSTVHGTDLSDHREDVSPSGAGSTDVSRAEEEEGDMYSGWSQDEMVKERKRLHKILNQFKNDFIENQGRAPEVFEMVQDPRIRDVYAQYHMLKQKTTAAKLEAAGETGVVAATISDASPEYNGDEEAAARRAAEEEEAMRLAEEEAERKRLTKGFNPFAKVLEDMNAEENARRQRNLAPIADGTAEVTEGAQPQDMSAEERELDILQKEVKMWKRGFKEREGRNPTRKDIKAEPDFAEKYFRVKELQGILGKTGKGDEGEAEKDDGGAADHSAVSEGEGGLQRKGTKKSSRRKLVFQEPDAAEGAGGAAPSAANTLTSEDTLDHTEDGGTYAKNVFSEEELRHVEEEEDINRRDLVADQEIAFRLLFNQIRAAGLVTKDTVADHKTRQPAGTAKSMEVVSTTTPLDDTTTARDEEDLARSIANYSAFAEEVRSVAASVTPIMGVGEVTLPTRGSDSQLSAPPPAVTQQGWSFPVEEESYVKGTGTTTMLAVDVSEVRADQVQHPPEEEEESMSLEELNEHRKHLGKELNQWKAHFKLVNNRQPTSKDIKLAPAVQKLYTEYTEIGKKIEALEKKLQRQQSSRTQQQKKRDSDRSPPLTPLSAARHQRGKLAKSIADWRLEFKAKEGRPPTLKDIAADETIASVFEQYSELNDQVNKQSANRDSGDKGDDLEEGYESGTFGLGATGNNALHETVALALRRKQLGKQLNEWKARFFDTYGRNPNVRDIKTDKTAAMMFEEYNLIPKNVEEEAQQGLDAADVDASRNTEMNIKEAKIRKKELNHVLNDWKAHFSEVSGRKPKVSDILADPVVAAVYAEFQELQTMINEMKSGGGGAVTGYSVQNVPEEGAGDDEGAAPGFAPWAGGSAATQSPPRAREDDGEDANNPIESVAPPPPAAIASDAPSPAKRKKRVTKLLNQWKAEFRDREGRNPTKADIKKDPTGLALFQEYQALREALGGADDEREDKNDTAAAHAEGERNDDGNQHEHSNNNNNNNETAESTPAVTPQFASPEPMTTTVTQQEGVSASSPPPEAGTLPAMTHDDQQGSPIAISVTPAIAETPDVSGTPAPLPQGRSASVEPRSPGTAKRVAKQLNHWKAEFKAREGRAPTKGDIKKDPDAFALFKEYQSLKESAGSNDDEDEHATRQPNEGDASVAVSPQPLATSPAPPPPEDDATGASPPPPSATDLKARKKLLNKQLNHWKAAFTEKTGRAPKQSDIQSDPDMLALYSELKTIKETLKHSDGGGDAGEGD